MCAHAVQSVVHMLEVAYLILKLSNCAVVIYIYRRWTITIATTLWQYGHSFVYILKLVKKFAQELNFHR